MVVNKETHKQFYTYDVDENVIDYLKYHSMNCIYNVYLFNSIKESINRKKMYKSKELEEVYQFFNKMGYYEQQINGDKLIQEALTTGYTIDKNNKKIYFTDDLIISNIEHFVLIRERLKLLSKPIWENQKINIKLKEFTINWYVPLVKTTIENSKNLSYFGSIDEKNKYIIFVLQDNEILKSDNMCIEYIIQDYIDNHTTIKQSKDVYSNYTIYSSSFISSKNSLFINAKCMKVNNKFLAILTYQNQDNKQLIDDLLSSITIK